MTDHRIHAALQAAAVRIKRGVAAAADRTLEALGSAALAAAGSAPRDVALAARFDFEQHLARFNQRFADVLDEKLAQDIAPRSSAGRPSAWTDWQSLSLVQDDEVEQLVSADRLSQAIAVDCEWELRELSTYIGALLKSGHAEREGNPLRPELIGKALSRALEDVTTDRDRRALLGRELVRWMAPAMKACYAEIVADLQQRGIEPVGLSVKTVAGPGHQLPRETLRRNSAYDSLASEGGGRDSASGRETLGLPSGHGEPLDMRGSESQRGSSVRGAVDSRRGGTRGAPIGNVEPEMMQLIRRLAFLGGQGDGEAVPDPDLVQQLSAPAGLAAANVIRMHRDELRSASTGALDHMVIDVVGSLFDQILSDPKVPPQMARQIGRLQLPVLRVALGDSSFFSSRRHPVRRFVNRIASLACAFEDFERGPGRELLAQVKDLVQQIVEGDFDRIEVYEAKLAELEAFTAQSNANAVQEQAEAATLLHRKETELRLQQRYMQTLQAGLAPLALPDFIREFLAQVWSQAVMGAVEREGAQSETARHLRIVGRELALSVQPKGTPQLRKAFLLKLPRLIKDLNLGLDRIGWPESARKRFFAQLQPAHSESLKGQPLSELSYNLLSSELDSALSRPVPQAGDLTRTPEPLPELTDVVLDQHFSTEEAERIGLVAESTVDWDGTVDIEVGLEAVDPADPGNATDIDIDIGIEGLPPADPPEPKRGLALVDQIEIGFAYQMLLKERWQKVRLSYVSPGRAFFVFTHGKKHQETISMTARMLSRMCESDRLRPFENDYLIERATARARKQLAALGSAVRH